MGSVTLGTPFYIIVVGRAKAVAVVPMGVGGMFVSTQHFFSGTNARLDGGRRTMDDVLDRGTRTLSAAGRFVVYGIVKVP